MKNITFLMICFIFAIIKAGAQDGEFFEIKGKELTMPLQIKKTYGAWTSAETKAIMSQAELNIRLKNTEKMERAKEFEKNPKLFLQKSNILLLKAKNASLGVTLHYYSYSNIPSYLSMDAIEMYDLWMSRLKPNPKTLKKLSNESNSYFAASKGDGTIDGKPVSFYFYTYSSETETNQVVIYSVPKQNANKCIMFFGDTFGMDWDSGEYLDGGH